MLPRQASVEEELEEEEAPPSPQEVLQFGEHVDEVIYGFAFLVVAVSLCTCARVFAHLNCWLSLESSAAVVAVWVFAKGIAVGGGVVLIRASGSNRFSVFLFRTWITWRRTVLCSI